MADLLKLYQNLYLNTLICVLLTMMAGSRPLLVTFSMWSIHIGSYAQKSNDLQYEDLLTHTQCSSVGGVTVSMVAFQAVDPGSTPGRRT